MSTRITVRLPHELDQWLEEESRRTGILKGRIVRQHRGMRITVGDVLSWLAEGMTEQEILQDFPELRQEDIRASLAYAADRENRQSPPTSFQPNKVYRKMGG